VVTNLIAVSFISIYVTTDCSPPTVTAKAGDACASLAASVAKPRPDSDKLVGNAARDDVGSAHVAGLMTLDMRAHAHSLETAQALSSQEPEVLGSQPKGKTPVAS